jgi:methionyl-tRNA formyltransferase
MLLQTETAIAPGENAVELGQRLSVMGAELLVETLAGLAAGRIVPQKQDPSLATYAPLLKKEDGLIDWTREMQAIHNQVRGLQPWPGAYTTFRGQALHLWRTRPWGGGLAQRDASPGKLVGLKPPVVGCGFGYLELLEVQLEGRKRIPAADFANGQRLTENEILGDPRT